MTDAEPANTDGALYELCARRGYRYADALVGNRAEAEELVQETFCRVLPAMRERGSIDREGFAPVFFRTLRNLSIDLLRARRHRPRYSIDEVPEPIAPPSDDGRDDADRLKRRLAAEIASMSPPLGEALQLRVQARLSYDEIAEVLGATRAQVRTWIYRARRQLEAVLEREDEPSTAPIPSPAQRRSNG